MKLLIEARLAYVLETIFKLRESIVEGVRMPPVRVELELLTIPVAIADPLKLMPSSVALAIEEFAHPLRPIELVDRSWEIEVEIASASGVVADWTTELSTIPKGMFKVCVLCEADALVDWPTFGPIKGCVTDRDEIEVGVMVSNTLFADPLVDAV
jgi:hypothetical protein